MARALQAIATLPMLGLLALGCDGRAVAGPTGVNEVSSAQAALPEATITRLGHLDPHPPSDPPYHIYAGIWGYAADGREYALVSGYFGLSIIDVTDPAAPEELFLLPMNGGDVHRDVATYGHYAYVGGQQGSDLHVVDLSSLPGSASVVRTFREHRDKTHTLHIEDGHLYLFEARGECHIFSLESPLDPTEVGDYRGNDCHDAFVRGDRMYVGGGWDNHFDIVDISDRSRPTRIGRTRSVSGIYAHSVAVTDDGQTMYAFEEANRYDILIYDVSDETAPRHIGNFELPGGSRVHNGWVVGDLLYVAYYEDGFVILDISDRASPTLVAQDDTHSGSAIEGFGGGWNFYLSLPSGNVLMSDTDTGLYVFQVDVETACTPSCNGSQCGDDGCGGACGTCSAGETCVDGACECVPSCNGRECGDDGCGGACGACGPGQVCASGACVSDCTPDCSGRECGDDGCGGACGTCSSGESCTDGMCECVPDCSGRECGGDGCGGTCGACDAGELCTNGACECVPDCSGRACGNDGCGGTCGTCGPEWVCGEGGHCACPDSLTACGAGCVDVRTDKAHCGGCDLPCGPGEVCAAGRCGSEANDGGVCEPACSGRQCGDDTCGGSCGGCPGARSCVSGGRCMCPAGLTSCESTCVDVRNDPEHCGACDAACERREVCSAGRCMRDESAAPPPGEATPLGDGETGSPTDEPRTLTGHARCSAAAGPRSLPDDTALFGLCLVGLALVRRRRPR